MPHQAFVLAAGHGTRLRPLTEHRPKPLVPVCGVPLLSYSLALCSQHGLTDIVLNAHWLHQQLESWEGIREGVRVTVHTEKPELLGTGGGLRAVRDHLDERFAVLNGDVLHAVDLGALLRQVSIAGGALALRPDPEHASTYGIVAADATATIVKVRQITSATPQGPVAEDTHFTGIHAMHRDMLDLLPEGFSCVIRTAYKEQVPKRLVRSIRYSGPWLDVGNPSTYLDANLAVLAGHTRLPLDPMPRAAWARDADGCEYGDPSVAINLDVRGACWIGHGAEIPEGTVLQNTVVGNGARFDAPIVLVDSVVWDHAHVPDRSGVRAVIHDGGWLEVDASGPTDNAGDT